MFPGELLPGILQTNGVLKSGSGGTAILASQHTTSPFDPKSCETYRCLFATKRVVAVWVQVNTHTKMLVFSVYARTAASKFPEVHAENDQLFHNILECASQFGPIPIVICGDFQLNPMHYKSLSVAINNHSWFDPLCSVDSNGDLYRPLTYSLDGLFSGPGDHCTSIDAILCNHVAFSALREIEVLPLKVQHRPIRATFCWESIRQVGHTLVKPAPFDLSQCTSPDPDDPLCPCHENATRVWTDRFHSSFDRSQSVDEQWAVANQYMIQVLLTNGARWDKGPHIRGNPPKFKETRISPGQTHFGDALSFRLKRISKALNLVREIYIRLTRPIKSFEDATTLSKSICRASVWLKNWNCPHVWQTDTLPQVCQVFLCLQWMNDFLLSATCEARKKRIQSWKDRIRASIAADKKYVFKHLKTKAMEEHPNLITDSAGNILYQPLDALEEFNNQWDQIFGANVLHEDPHMILRVVWPYVADFAQEASVPPISAFDLHQQIKRRKPDAAPGLDGWRTQELQILPWFAFVPIATIFNQIENNLSDLPQVLTIAKQMVLNKNGDPSPMQKRLITLLPVLLLGYTGLRFRQLQAWQSNVIPSNLCGGIRGRTMSSVHTTLRLDLDTAKSHGNTLVGLKLDKSKCFDRIIPSIAGALMMAFGAPRGVVHFFIQMYTNLKRHLALRGWISPLATTASNGVAQGCSFSLIAVNLIMAVWAIFMNLIPQVTAKAFIDDAYLWASICNLDNLLQAYTATNFWDSMVGQTSNPAKCQLWVSDTKSKSKARSRFPNIPVADTIDVLGIKIYTHSSKSFDFDKKKTGKIIDDIRNIDALPIPTQAKLTLICSKVVPQVTYGAAITKIPQHVIWKTQNEIVNVLWANRPHWRSRMLVLGLLGKPHRCEPRMARAYNAVLDFVRFLHQHSSFIAVCRTLQAATPWPAESLLWQLQHCLGILGLKLVDDLSVSFRGSEPIPLYALNHKDFAKPLQYFAQQKCYTEAVSNNRKDIVKCHGILDPDLSSLFLRKSKLHFDSPFPIKAFFDSVRVGCQLTNDRLFRAGLVDNPKCRLCNAPKESWEHLVHECTGVSSVLPRPADHDFGANFAQFGLYAHPRAVAMQRLRVSSTGESSQLFDPQYRDIVWTDGSVQWNTYFWLASGAYSIVAENAEVLECGPVRHWELCAYTTELFAIVRAIKRATCRLLIRSDCLSVVNQFQDLLTFVEVPNHWAHRPWWNEILEIVQVRRCQHSHPVIVEWIPSHVLEDVPVHLVTESLAQQHGSTYLDVVNNRRADRSANDEAVKCSAIHPQDQRRLENAILHRQEWLVIVSHMLEVHKPAQPDVVAQPVVDNPASHLYRFPLWPWNAVVENYTWKPKIPKFLPVPHKWPHELEDWKYFREFFMQLHWRIDDNFSVSVVELACIFWWRGFKHSQLEASISLYMHLITTFRAMLKHLQPSELCQPFPCGVDTKRNKSCGRELPKGIFHGVDVLMSDDERFRLIHIFDEGAGRALSSWDSLLPVQ